MVEEEESEEEMVELAYDKEVMYANEKEILVIYKNLSRTPKEEDGKWLQKSIFHTRCTSHGKVYDLIIDFGSYSNVVAKK